METGKNPEGWDARDWAFAFGKLVPWIERPGELEEFLREHPRCDAWWSEFQFDRVVATGVWEAPVGYEYPSDEIESMLAALDPPHGTLTISAKRSLFLYASNPCAKPRYLAASLGDALDEFDRAAGAGSIWAPEGMRYHMEMLVSGLGCAAESLRDAVRICRMHPADRYWAFGREFDRGVLENLSDLIDEEDASIDEVLALGDALEPPTGSDTWALLSTRLEEMAPPGTSWKDLAKAHPWLADAHWSAAEEERARLWYGAYCWCERLVMQVRGINPPCESLEVFFRDNPADGYWDLGEPFDLLVTSQLVERYQKLEPVGACARADSKMMTVRMVDADHSPDGDRRKGRDEVASISTLVNAPAGTLTEAWLADVEEAESVERECPPPDGLNEYIRRLLISECGYGGSDEEIPVGITCGALTLVHTKMLEACRGSDYSLIKPYSEDADIAADAANWLEHFREIEVTEDNLTGVVRFVLAFPPGRFWLLSRKSFDIPLDSWLMSVFKNKLSSSMLRFLLDELMAPKDSATYNSIMGHMEAMKEYEESQKADEYEEKLRETGEGREPGAPESGMTERGASCPANKNMIVDEAPRGPLFDATDPGPSALPRPGASSGAVARAARVPSSGGEASRGVPAVGGSDQGPSRQPAQRGKALKALCAAVLVLAVAIVAFAGYARWHDQREREEHEAYMASLERLDRGELEAAIAANAAINEAFIKAELANGQRADALDEDVEILSIDLEDGDLVSGWVNAVCTVRGLESGAVYEVDLGLRDDGVVKYVFGYMVADER